MIIAPAAEVRCATVPSTLLKTSSAALAQYLGSAGQHLGAGRPARPARGACRHRHRRVPLAEEVSGSVLTKLRYSPVHVAWAQPGGPKGLAGKIGDLMGEPPPGDIDFDDEHWLSAYPAPE